MTNTDNKWKYLVIARLHYITYIVQSIGACPENPVTVAMRLTAAPPPAQIPQLGGPNKTPTPLLSPPFAFVTENQLLRKRVTYDTVATAQAAIVLTVDCLQFRIQNTCMFISGGKRTILLWSVTMWRVSRNASYVCLRRYEAIKEHYVGTACRKLVQKWALYSWQMCQVI